MKNKFIEFKNGSTIFLPQKKLFSDELRAVDIFRDPKDWSYIEVEDMN